MDAADRPSAPNELPQLTKVPIAQLSPTLEQSQEKCIEAAVTLVWPYSSSTKSFSLLLAEPDFRLRRSHGQVKTIFHGRAAEKVAASHVGIGDSVRVALKGSNYVANDMAPQTPGRYVAWDVHFDSELSLEVSRASKDSSTVFIEEHSSSRHDSEQAPPSTPRVASTDLDSATTIGQTSWDSPAFFRPSPNQFGLVLHASLEIPAEEDGFVPGKGRKRPRYSLKRDDWHLVEDPISPQEKDEPGMEWWEKDSWEKASDESANGEQEPEGRTSVEADGSISNPDAHAIDQASSAHASREHSPVFIKPSLDMPGGIFGRNQLQTSHASTSSGSIATSFQDRLISASHCATDTPQLRPIPSPGLPIPSPLISNSPNSEGYFSGIELPSQTLNGDNVSLEADASVIMPEPISVTNISTTSPPPGTSLASEAVENLHQNDGNAFAGPTLIIDRGSPSDIQRLEPTDVRDSLLVSHPGTISPSEKINDAGVESSNDLPCVEEQDELATDSRVGIQRIMPDIDQEEIGSEEESDMEYRELTNPSLAPGVDFDPKDHQTVHPNIELSAHNATNVNLHEEVHGEPHEVSEPDNNQDKYYDDEDGSEDSAGESQRRGPLSPPAVNSSENDSLESAEESIDYVENDRTEADFESHDSDGDVEDDWDRLSDDKSEAENLPKSQQAQPEIIVLDSDSEDELTSDQPMAPPSMRLNHSQHQYSSPRPQSEDEEWDSDVDGIGSQSEAQDYDDEGNDEAGHIDMLERVHESDKEDESSVDVLARDHNIEQYSSRGASVYDDNYGDDDEKDAQNPDSVAMSSKGYHSTGSVIDLDSDSDEQVSQAASYGFHREDSAPASRIEKAWSTKVVQTFDGANDEDLDETASLENAEEHATEKDSNLVSTTAHQLMTPDLTQDALAGSLNSEANDHDETFDNEDTKDAEGNQESFGNPVDVETVDVGTPVDSDLFTSHQESNSMPESPIQGILTGSHESEPFVVVPTTEPTQLGEQLQAPEEEPREVPKVIVSQLPAPDRHAHGLRSKLSYFAPLATLVDHYGAEVDTLSVVHEASPISKTTAGSKDYFMTIHLSDPSMAGTLLQAQIFRRYKSAMPTLVEGNAVLLRNFKVSSYDHSIMLVSVESSSWAVFEDSGPEAQVNGPPVEYSSEERAFASGLRNWYAEIGTHMIADHQLQASIQFDDMDREGSAVLSESGSMDSVSRDPTSSARGSRRRKSYRRVTIHELRDGRRYTEVGSPSTKESIHELRDGTVYANL